MRPALPIAMFRKVALFGSLLSAVGCRHGGHDATVAPGPPILAESEIQLENFDTECAGLIAALYRYGLCPNLEDGDRQWVRAAIEAAENSFAAGKKSNPDEPSQHVMAMACHRAADTMHAATERCLAGKRPRVD